MNRILILFFTLALVACEPTVQDLESAKEEYNVVMVEFYSDGCYVCRIVEPAIDEIEEEYPEVKVLRIDINAEEGTRSEYGIQYVPTVVVYAKGVEVWRLIGKDGTVENTKAKYEEGIEIATKLTQ